MTPSEMYESTQKQIRAEMRKLEGWMAATSTAPHHGQLVKQYEQLSRALDCNFGPRAAAVKYITGDER